MIIRYGLFLTAAVIVLSAYGSAIAADTEPPSSILKEGKCLVTKESASKYPDWVVCNKSSDGTWNVFIGMKTFLAYVNEPEKYIGSKVRHSGTVLIKDHKTHKWISALFAYFVVGEKIIGPFGRDAVAFAEKEDAENYQKKVGGVAVLRMMDLRKSVLAFLNNSKPDTADADSVIVPKVIDIKNAPRSGTPSNPH